MVNANGKVKTQDPQLTVTGRMKTTASGSEILVFSVKLAFFELVAICNIPEEGCDTAPCYLKFKIATPRPHDGNSGQRPEDKEDDTEG